MQQYIEENGLQGLYPFKLVPLKKNGRDSILCESADGRIVIYAITIMSNDQREALVRYINGDINYATFLMQKGIPRDAFLENGFMATDWCQVTTDIASRAFCLSVVADFETSLTDIPAALSRLIAVMLNGQDPDAILEEVPLPLDEFAMQPLVDPETEAETDRLEEMSTGSAAEERKETRFGDYVLPFHATDRYIEDAEGKSLIYFSTRLGVEAGNRLAGLLNGDPAYAKLPAGTIRHHYTKWYSVNENNDSDMCFELPLDESLRQDPGYINEILALLQEPEEDAAPAETAVEDIQTATGE